MCVCGGGVGGISEILEFFFPQTIVMKNIWGGELFFFFCKKWSNLYCVVCHPIAYFVAVLRSLLRSLVDFSSHFLPFFFCLE